MLIFCQRQNQILLISWNFVKSCHTDKDFLFLEFVKILIENGAEKLVENDKGQISVQLTTSDEVRVLLGGCVEEKQKQVVSKNETNWSSPQSDDSNKLVSCFGKMFLKKGAYEEGWLSIYDMSNKTYNTLIFLTKPKDHTFPTKFELKVSSI